MYFFNQLRSELPFSSLDLKLAIFDVVIKQLHIWFQPILRMLLNIQGRRRWIPNVASHLSLEPNTLFLVQYRLDDLLLPQDSLLRFESQQLLLT